MFRRRQVLTHTYADANTEDEALLAFALNDAREDEPVGQPYPLNVGARAAPGGE